MITSQFLLWRCFIVLAPVLDQFLAYEIVVPWSYEIISVKLLEIPESMIGCG